MDDLESMSLINTLGKFLPRLRSTYVWAATLSDCRLFERRDEKLLSWWLFLLIGCAAFVTAFTANISSVLRVNIFSLNSGYTPGSTADAIYQLGDNANLISSQIHEHTLGTASAVFILSILACFAASLTISFAINFIQRKNRSLIIKYASQTAFVFSVTLIKTAGCWTLLMLASLGLQVAGLMPDMRIHDIHVYGIFIFLSSIGTLIWIWYERWKIFKLRRSTGRSTIFAIMFSIVAPIFPSQLSLWASNLYVPHLDISISPQCDKEGCFAYIRTQNVGKISIDAPLRFQVKLAYPNNLPGKEKYIYGTADILLSKKLDSAGVISLDPDSEEIAVVRKVTLTCKNESGAERNLIPAEATGQPVVHLQKYNQGGDRAVLEANLRGFLILLFRHAEGNCATF